MSATIRTLPPSSTMTPDQALASAMEFGATDLIIVGYDCNGAFFTRSSRMSRRDALWLAEKLKEWALAD